MRTDRGLLVPFLLSLIVCGCATDQKFRIETKQPGARITIDDIDAGTSPCELTFPVKANGKIRGGVRTIKAYPLIPGQYVQTLKLYRLRDSGGSNRTRTLYLDLDLQPPADSPPARTGAHVGVGLKHWVSETIDGGAFIKLEDGSLWHISPIDRINTMLWLPTDEVVVMQSKNPQYPYRLVGERDTAEAELLRQ